MELVEFAFRYDQIMYSFELAERGQFATHSVVFTEDIVKIAGQQGRYAVWHGLHPLGIERGLRYLDPERLY